MDRHVKKRVGLIGSVILSLQVAALPPAAAQTVGTTVEQTVDLAVQSVDAIAASSDSLVVTLSNGNVSVSPPDGTLSYETNDQNCVLTAQLGNTPPSGLHIYVAVGDNASQLLSDKDSTILGSGIGPGTGRLSLSYSADVGLLTPPGTYDFAVVFSLTNG